MALDNLKKKRKFFINNSIIIILFWLLFLFVRIFLFKIVNFINSSKIDLFYDEGTYLYTSKLISKGLVPFRDFFIGHMPFYQYLLSFFWKIGFDFVTIHYLHIFLSSLVVFPLFLFSKKIIKNKIILYLPVLLITFSPFYLLFSLLVILDPIMTSFLIWGLYFYFFPENKPKKFLAGLFFALATLIKISALASIFSLLLADFIFDKNKKKFFSQTFKKFLLGYFIVIIPVFIWLFSFPQFFNNLFLFHLVYHYPVSIYKKISYLKSIFNLDTFLTLLGPLIAIFLVFFSGRFFSLSPKISPENKKSVKILSLYLIIGYLISLFAFRTFYPQHIIQFLPGFSLIFSFFVFLLWENLFIKSKNYFLNNSLIVVFLISLSLFLFYSFYSSHLKQYFSNKNQIKEAIEILKSKRGYLYTSDLDFALLSQREITPWYYSALPDAAHSFNISDQEYNQIIDKTKTIILTPRTIKYLPPATMNFIYQKFKIIFQNQSLSILERKN